MKLKGCHAVHDTFQLSRLARCHHADGASQSCGPWAPLLQDFHR